MVKGKKLARSLTSKASRVSLTIHDTRNQRRTKLELAIKWFPGGADSEPEDYEGGRELDDFADL